MKIFLKQNTFDAALDRIRYLFAEFPTVICNVSGGKDSTVCLNLCMQVAREMKRLPLPVMWIDQEVEWQGTVDYCDWVMRLKDVRPMWLQVPMIITNNASSIVEYNHCWRESEKDKWTHPKSDISLKENVYGTDRFHDLFHAVIRYHYPNQRACYITGMRAEEAPKRFLAVTDSASYKWITWARVLSKDEYYSFHPIYDWTVTDVWKAIHDNKWKYNVVYNDLYRLGIAPTRMRISNLHHETSIRGLLLVQEIEPVTWSRIADRISGANAIKHIKNSAFTCPSTLPFMFKNWDDYLRHIIDSFVLEKNHREMVERIIYNKNPNVKRALVMYVHEPIRTSYIMSCVNSILCSDWELIRLQNFVLSPETYEYRKWREWRGEIKVKRHVKVDTKANISWCTNKFIPEEFKDDIRKATANYQME